MDVRFNLFPGGLKRVLTLSYDDGSEYDRRLLFIMNKYGIKGTFHLNSSNLDKNGYVKSNEVKNLYEGHEVACHTCSHPFLSQLPRQMQIQEIQEDRDRLEQICRYPVRGLSWPYGEYCEESRNIAEICGVEYSRLTMDTKKFGIPTDFMKWQPTTHHSGDLDSLWEAFFDEHREDMKLFYIWGHSIEFEKKNNWNKIETFCKNAGGRKDVWYATNIEIKEYLDALRRLVFSTRMDMIYNPSAMDVWISVNGQAVCVKGGTKYYVS